MDGYALKFGRRKEKQRAWKRVCLIVAVVGAIGTIVAAAAIPATVRLRLGGADAMAGDRFHLLRLLADYKCAWHADDRAAVVDRARQGDVNLDNAFHWLLCMPQHPLVPQALELVAAMKVQSVLADVQALRRSKTLAPRALVAQDSIEPLPQEELDEALIGRDKAMQLAVLQVAQHRDPPLLPTMLELLRQGDKDVRAAAMAALPERLPEDLLPQLRGIATEASADVAIAGLSALGRVPMTDEVELFLAEQGARSELPVARAALAALANRGVRLAADTSHQLWQLVGDPNCDRGIMARAFLCLEQTKSSTAGEALAQAASLDEFGRYFAARIAISAGDQGGIEMMLSLCDGRDKQVRFAARGLLAGLAKSPASAEETWRAFFAGSTWTTVGALPKPLLDL